MRNVQDAEGASRALAEAVERADYVLIIAEAIAELIRDEIDRLRFGATLPLVVEVPGGGGYAGTTASLFRLIHEAVGIRFE